MSNNEVSIKDVRTALNIFNNVVFRDVVNIIEPTVSLSDESVGFVVEFKTVVGAKLSKQVTLCHKVTLSESMSISDMVTLFASNIMSGIIRNAADIALTGGIDEKSNDKTKLEEWFDKFGTLLYSVIRNHNSIVITNNTPAHRRVLFNHKDTTATANDADGSLTINLAYSVMDKNDVVVIRVQNFLDKSPTHVVFDMVAPVYMVAPIYETVVKDISSEHNVRPTEEVPLKNESVNQTPVPVSIGVLDSVALRNKFLETMRAAIAIYNNINANQSPKVDVVFQNASFTSYCVDDRYQEVVINFSYFSLPGSKGNKTFVSIDMSVDYTVDMIVHALLPSVRNYLIVGIKPQSDSWLGVLLNGPQTKPKPQFPPNRLVDTLVYKPRDENSPQTPPCGL